MPHLFFLGYFQISHLYSRCKIWGSVMMKIQVVILWAVMLCSDVVEYQLEVHSEDKDSMII
jgi:hypothetical protein